jgi:zinc transporter ZupT
VPTAAIAAFAAAGLATRAGCGCQEHKEQASGAGTAAALTVHRFLEGAAIALAGSAVVALALTAHAFGKAWPPGRCLVSSHAGGWRAGWP